MITTIANVSTAKNGSKRKYATTLMGVALFPLSQDMEIKKGQTAIVQKRVQTKTTGADGKLVDIPADQRPVVNIITAVFDDRKAAIDAVVADQSGDIEVQAQLQKMAKDYGIEDFSKLESLA